MTIGYKNTINSSFASIEQIIQRGERNQSASPSSTPPKKQKQQRAHLKISHWFLKKKLLRCEDISHCQFFG